MTRPIATTSTLASRRRRNASSAPRASASGLGAEPGTAGGFSVTVLLMCRLPSDATAHARLATCESGDRDAPRYAQTAMAPERSTNFTAVSEPWYRVVVFR